MADGASSKPAHESSRLRRLRYGGMAWAIGIIIATGGYAQDGLRPDEVLVIANRASTASMAVAADYMKRRQIPKGQLFLLDDKTYAEPEPLDANPRWMPRPVFRRTVVQPLKAFLEKKQLKDKILCLVTVYDTPYRVGAFAFTAPEKEALMRALTARPEGLRTTLQGYARAFRFLRPRDRKFLQPILEEGSSYAALGEAKQKELLSTLQRLFRHANASFDSELAMLYSASVDAPGLDDYQRLLRYMEAAPNPFRSSPQRFRLFRQKQIEVGSDRLYMVARLDGPSPEIAKGLAEKAMQAEARGVAGAGYFDAKRDGRTRKGMALGDWWIRRAAIETRNAGFTTTHTTKGHVLAKGECPDALFYWGWYKPFSYNSEAFNGQFPLGAIGCHIASYEAAHLRTKGRTYKKGKQGPWCAGMLTDGITATMGPVAEPYLHTFPYTEVFFSRLFQGWALAEAYWAAIPNASWMLILIGDPLYTPFGGKRQLANYATGGIQFIAPTGDSVELVLGLQAPRPLFKNPSQYRVVEPGNNDPAIRVAGMAEAKFTVLDGGRKLLVKGLRLTREGKARIKNQELEMHIDLGRDGGVKIVSQPLPLGPDSQRRGAKP